MIKSKSKTGAKISEYIPQFPDKYIGSYPIMCRSSWERMYAQYLDASPFVVEWSSEGNVIPYFDPTRHKQRRYYPDFYVKMKNGRRSKRFLVEIKPYKETKPPTSGRRKSNKTKMYQESTWETNKAKWRAAQKYCKKMGLEFKILSENELFGDKKK